MANSVGRLLLLLFLLASAATTSALMKPDTDFHAALQLPARAALAAGAVAVELSRQFIPSIEGATVVLKGVIEAVAEEMPGGHYKIGVIYTSKAKYWGRPADLVAQVAFVLLDGKISARNVMAATFEGEVLEASYN
ncbi:hypothetical protein AXF42_Ash007241 [Apostasia shenzhenica]|uniref:Uncharacterized protein n=1 Tax=Apostasia shenzhenica TaxID=1088818 RepID=A0A2I0B9N3_9ASPA|nr:hypothetical protein AXF42_Ash007241 [Apostasia shenzhenica]